MSTKPFKLLDEKALLHELKSGNVNAYIYMYTEYRYWMFLQAYETLADKFAAQDLVQELMVDFWQFQLYDNIKTTLKGYLSSIIRNRVYNYLRDTQRRAKRMKDIPVQDYLLPDLNLDKDELSIKLKNALQKLPAKTLLVFTYFYEEGLSYKQIATKTGNSTATINTHINKARKILKKELKTSF